MTSFCDSLIIKGKKHKVILNYRYKLEGRVNYGRVFGEIYYKYL